MTSKKSRSVQPTWCSMLPLQQQSVLFLATRGPDGVGKYHPCKAVQRAYRACVLLAGKFGRCLLPSDPGDSFMTLRVIVDSDAWGKAVEEFFDAVDSLPHHYLAHLMHGAQILGYKHPDACLRGRWRSFYEKMVDDLHLRPESEAEMDGRLGDWRRESWHE
jgi:hypothetical protein